MNNPPFEYTSQLGNSETSMGRPWSLSVSPSSDSVRWKDPSVSPNEAADPEAACDLDCKQEIQSRTQRENVGRVQTHLFFPARRSCKLEACNYFQLQWFYDQVIGLQPTILFLGSNGGLESFLEPLPNR